jgi:acyl-homoserine-lactone acylase
LIALAALAACGSGDGDSSRFSAEIRRTEMGIPHIKARDWLGLGYGMGYAQAQDNLCTMADSFLTYRGERSRYLGGTAQAVYDSTIDRPANLDSDFFFRHVVSDDAVAAMIQAQPTKLVQLVEGFVAGYNRVVRETPSGSKSHAACAGQPWVQAITPQDIWRRMYTANLAGGYSNFVAQIANAVPPAAAATAAARGGATQVAALKPGQVVAPSMQVGGTRGIGSNMYGFGQQATGGSSLLFGNPHWYWKGPDRFYQAQLTIAGEIDVSGASFLGVPLVLIGFNNDVAWSHTVSTARRFGLFMYQLAPGNPTSYVRDGKVEPMQASKITVSVRNASGGLDQVTRTLYKTVHGPVVNLGAMDPALGWTTQSVFAIRDINAYNYRTFRNWLRWNQAKSLDEFMRIQKEESAIPWVNTVAAGRNSAQVWYADMGAVPNVPPAQLQACATPASAAINVALPQVPVLAGGSSQCDWSSDADSVQPGAVGPARMPSLLRSDYVGNMNDSYWLSNATAPLTGYPAIFGSTASAQSLRTRMGHTMALQRLAGTDGYPGRLATSEIVRQMVLDSRVYSARFKDETLALVCDQPTISVGGSLVQVGAACNALRAWDGTGTAAAKGSHVWDEFWKRAVVQVKAADLYVTPFSAADPINTPNGIKATAQTALKQALGQAVQALQSSGFAPDAARGTVLFSARGGEKIALYGGCGEVGYFTITCSENKIEQGGYSMDGQPHGNSYMQVVSFPAAGVEAYTFLTFSLSDDPASSHYTDYTKAYGARQWVKMPFTDSAIQASTGYSSTTVRE